MQFWKYRKYLIFSNSKISGKYRIYSKTSLARHHRYQARFWQEARWRVNGSDLSYNTRQENTGPPTGFNEEKTDRNVSRVGLIIVVIDWVIHLFTVPNYSRYRLSHPFIHGNPYRVVNQLIVRRRKKSDTVVCFWPNSTCSPRGVLLLTVAGCLRA